MDAKTHILRAIRSHRLAEAELPPLDGPWITYADRKQQFVDVLASVGGQCRRVADMAQAQRELAELPQLASAKKICSVVPGLGLTGPQQEAVDLATIDDPHLLEDIDVAMLPGEFAVAENGAIWVTDRGLRQRVIYFIAQHLVLVVSADQIVDNMHEAYQRLRFPGAGFGVFISGPSKTADIEQSLVIGAHGPRSLTVFLVER